MKLRKTAGPALALTVALTLSPLATAGASAATPTTGGGTVALWPPGGWPHKCPPLMPVKFCHWNPWIP